MKLNNAIKSVLYAFKNGTSTQEDYEQIFSYLYKLYLRKYGSKIKGEEEIKDLIHNFLLEKLLKNLDTFILKCTFYLKSAFFNYIIDMYRVAEKPKSNLFNKIRKLLEKQGFSRINKTSYIYAPGDWTSEQKINPPISLDEIRDLDLSKYPFKSYKENSKKVDEVIDSENLNLLIKELIEKYRKPIDVNVLTEAISSAKNIVLGKINISIEEYKRKGDEKPFAIQDLYIQTIELEEIAEKFIQELSPSEQKTLKNYIENIPPEKEAQEEGCSHQTIRNRRKKLEEKISKLLKEHNISKEDFRIFINLLKKYWSKN